MSFITAALIIGGAGVIGGGMSAYGNYAAAKQARKGSGFQQAPESPEAVGARELLWKDLQGQNADNNYGAISPDWADIWQNAQDKVRQYYWGSPTQMGVAGKVKASAAKRGVSDSPALDANLTAMGAEEGNQIKDISTQMGVQKTNLTESARKSWLSNLLGLTGSSPNSQYIQGTGYSPWSDIGKMVSGVGASVGGLMAQGQQNDWLKSLYNNPQTMQAMSLTNGGIGNVYGTRL